jgi:SPOR domain
LLAACDHGTEICVRRLLAAAALALTAAAGPAVASDALPDLVSPRQCLAGGSYGVSSQAEWRIQLGIFDDHASASRFASGLRAKGLGADEYVAAWLVRDDREPIVVVSREQPSRREAARAVGRYGAAIPGAFVRRYRVWR